MRRLISTVFVLFVLLAYVAAQQKAPAKTDTPAGNKQTKQSAAGSAAPASNATVDSFLRHMFGYDPSLSWQIVNIAPSPAAGVADVTVVLKNPQGQQSVHLYVTPDEKHAIVGELLPFGADPFAAARAEIAARANGVERGPANAAVTIVEFSDLECPSCKAAQPTIDRLLSDEPDVKFIFQNFPLQRIHPWAFLAASYADCVAQQNKNAFWKFIESVYSNQEQITALLPTNASSAQEQIKQAEPAIAKKLQDLASGAGANAQQVATCSTQPATAARIASSIKLGEDLGVTGTPTIYINGRRVASVGAMPYETLKSIVDYARKTTK